MKKPPLIPTLITLFFVVFMTSMGFWQIRRAHEKEQLLVLLADENITKITQKIQVRDLPRYANVEITGYYLSAPQLLLDNQVDEGRQGYHVFTPFYIDDLNLYIMVNRGWLAKAEYKTDKLTVNTDVSTLSGKLNTPPQVGIQLGEISLDTNQSQQVMTYYDIPKVSAFLHESLCKSLDCLVSDKIFWLKKDQAQGFKRNWNPIIMPPAKHTAYAVQWFGMTLVLIIIFVYWLRKTS